MTDLNELSLLGEERSAATVSQFQGLVSNSEELTFLMGAGCSKCAGLPLTNELTDKVLAGAEIEVWGKEILTVVKEQFASSVGANTEDYLSEIVDLLAITERRAEREVQEDSVLIGSASYTSDPLRNTSDQIKQAIARAIKAKVNVDTY